MDGIRKLSGPNINKHTNEQPIPTNEVTLFSFFNKLSTTMTINRAVIENSTPLVVGYSPFSEKFSPFYADTAYDQDVASMTQVSLLTTDRVGGIVYNAIEGETVPYNGTDYTYTPNKTYTVGLEVNF